jgi:DNA-binding PadR family transcriptional regulator
VTQGDIADGYRQEIRRGLVVLACLIALKRPDYGYQLLKTLQSAGIPSDANTIYPLLRRLEERQLLVSEWNTQESRPRKFYRTSESGLALADELMGETARLNGALRTLLEGGTE